MVNKITNVPGDDLIDPIRLGPVQTGHNIRPRRLGMEVRTDHEECIQVERGG